MCTSLSERARHLSSEHGVDSYVLLLQFSYQTSSMLRFDRRLSQSSGGVINDGRIYFPQ
jgi:hypothetical protein